MKFQVDDDRKSLEKDLDQMETTADQKKLLAIGGIENNQLPMDMSASERGVPAALREFQSDKADNQPITDLLTTEAADSLPNVPPVSIAPSTPGDTAGKIKCLVNLPAPLKLALLVCARATLPSNKAQLTKLNFSNTVRKLRPLLKAPALPSDTVKLSDTQQLSPTASSCSEHVTPSPHPQYSTPSNMADSMKSYNRGCLKRQMSNEVLDLSAKKQKTISHVYTEASSKPLVRTDDCGALDLTIKRDKPPAANVDRSQNSPLLNRLMVDAEESNLVMQGNISQLVPITPYVGNTGNLANHYHSKVPMSMMQFPVPNMMQSPPPYSINTNHDRTTSQHPVVPVPRQFTANHPEVAIARAHYTEVAVPRAYNPGAALPRAYYPGAAEPRAHHPEGAVPRAHHPGAAEPRAYHPEMASPRAHHPEMALPRAHHPEMASPRAHHPEMALHRAHHPEMASPRAHHPEMASPRAHHPEMALHRAHHPEMASPRAHHPEMALPRAHHPEMALPRAHHPEMALPRARHPEVAVPRAPHSDVAVPNFHKSMNLPQSYVPNIEYNPQVTDRPHLLQSPTVSNTSNTQRWRESNLHIDLPRDNARLSYSSAQQFSPDSHPTKFTGRSLLIHRLRTMYPSSSYNERRNLQRESIPRIDLTNAANGGSAVCSI